MPQADKSAPDATSSGRSDYEGRTFTTPTATDLMNALRAAFDYRGDVTLELSNGTEVEGFVHNFSIERDTVSLFVPESKRESYASTVKASDIKSIKFTGPDTAFGKSWDDWMAKSERQKAAEAERLKKEAIERGHL